MKLGITALASILLLSGVAVSASSGVSFENQSCLSNCSNNRTACLSGCNEYSTENGKKRCITRCHDYYASCARRCN